MRGPRNFTKNLGADTPFAPDDDGQPSPQHVVAAPPGAPRTSSSAPGGMRKQSPKHPDLLTLPIEQRGADMAKKGRPELERWVNELVPDEMARVSLSQLKVWRNIADKVSAG